MASPVQVVHRTASVDFTEVDLSEVSGKDQSHRIATDITRRKLKGYDLARPPLMDVVTYRLEKGRYQIVWHFHHIIYDAMSLPMLLRDLADAYGREKAGNVGLIPTATGYREYIQWISRRDPVVDRKYWETELAGFSEPTRLKLPPPGTAGDRLYLQDSLSYDESQLLRTYARRSRVALSAIYCAAWALTLRSFGGGSDLCFGLVCSGRPSTLDQASSTVGVFANTVPLRVQVSRVAAVQEWLREIHGRLPAVADNVYLNLAEVQQCSQLPHGTSLFDSLLSIEQFEWLHSSNGIALANVVTGFTEAGIKVSNIEYDQSVPYPICVAVTDSERIGIRVNFDPGKIAQSDCSRIISSFRRFLRELVSNESKVVSEFANVDPAEEERILGEFSGSRHFSHPAGTIVDVFEDQVRLTPESVAVVADDGHLTYRALSYRSSKVAQTLRLNGIRPGDIVPIVAERSLHFLIGVYGILKAGGAYAPVDPAWPQLRIQQVLDNCSAKVCLLIGRTTIVPTSLFSIDLKSIGDVAGTTPFEIYKPGAKDLAYVIYTSGTTGTPKGVMIEHGSVIAMIRALEKSTSPTDSTAQQWAMISSLCFDVSAGTIFSCTLTGATLHIIPRDMIMAPAKLVDYLRLNAIEVIDGTPTHLHIMLPSLERNPPPRLQQMLVAGEPLERKLVEKFFHAFGANHEPIRLGNLYGPTECCVYSTLAWLDRDFDEVTIGRPLENYSCYILDEEQRPVPIGVEGELFIGGLGLARGYLGMEELTNSRFKRYPVAGGSILYATGDLARWTLDGRIQLNGRKDDQVKIRGFRIELQEIETVLMRLEGVKRCAVITASNPETELVAVFEGSAEPAALRAEVRATLPHQMVPSRIVRIESMPRTPTGKLDKKALQKLFLNVQLSPPPEAARDLRPSKLESEVIVGFSDVLSTDALGTDDNFFDRGGHSLKAVALTERLSRQYAIDLTALDLIQAPTPRELTETIARKIAETTRSNS